MQTIMTRYGELTPQHTADSLRKKDILPVEFHESGTPKAIPLEQQERIVTSAGELPAEMVTFHESGALNRVFPLNGKLSGYWSESDEAGLAEPLTVNTPVGPITTRVISVGFYDTGALRSITLWPGETLSVKTPAGFIETRIGLSFSPDGCIRSVEPARPTPVTTPAGEILAFDPDVIGVNGDRNSLEFDGEGAICRLTTVTTQVKAVSNDGRTTTFSPQLRESYCSESEREPIPMRIVIENETVTIRQGELLPQISIPMRETLFFTAPLIPEFEGHTPLACTA